MQIVPYINSDWTLNRNYESATSVRSNVVKEFSIENAKDIEKILVGKKENEKNLANLLWEKYCDNFITSALGAFSIWNQSVLRVELFNKRIICIDPDTFEPIRVKWMMGIITFIFPEVQKRNWIQIMCVKLENGNLVYINSNFWVVKLVRKQENKK